MLKAFLLVFWRQLQQRRVVALINIAGLTLGLLVFLLLMLYVRDELSWERHWRHSDRLVRLLQTNISGDNEQTIPGGAAVYLPTLLQEFDGSIEAGTRWVFLRDQYLDVEGVSHPNSVYYVDSAFVELFDLQLLHGDLQQTLAAPGRVALTTEDAERLYGTAEAVGRALIITGADGVQRHYEVTAVFAKPTGRTQVPVTSFTLLHEGAEGELGESLVAWTGYLQHASQFFLLRPGTDLAALNNALPAFLDRHLPGDGDRPASTYQQLRLQPLTAARFEPTTGLPGTDLRQLATFAALACLVLGIGIVNYGTLATAQSVQRRREIGVKKAAGASRGALLLQFMGESLLYSVVSLLLALVLCELLLPAFSTLVGQQLQLHLLAVDTLGLLLLLLLVTAVAGGAWPGLVLSRYRPERVLRRGDERLPGVSLRLRSLLLGGQFTIAIALMLATLVLYFQMDYLRGRDAGFVADDVVSITGFNSGLGQPLTERLREQVCALPGVTACSLASRWVSSMDGVLGRAALTGRRGDEQVLGVDDVNVGYEFFDLYRIPLLAGRSFDAALDQRDPDTRRYLVADGGQDERGRIVLNMTAVRALGFASAEEAVGQELYNRVFYQGEVSYRPQLVIGVVADNQWLNLRERPAPLSYSLGIPNFAFFIQARVAPAEREAFRNSSEALWKQLGGERTLHFRYADDTKAAAFARETLEGKLVLAAALLAIALSCLGLFGLVLFELQGRTKEIGMRKVLGAGTGELVAQFSWHFARPVLIASLLAWPLAGWAMLQWLQRFPYRIDTALLLPLGLLAGVLALLVALVTAALATARAVGARPLRSLRYE